MADPHLLYVVSAVVALGLVAWVIVVLARAPDLPDVRVKHVEGSAPAPAPAAEARKEPRKEEPRPSEPQEEPASKKPSLDAHLEIQDEKSDDEKKET
jgi:hypothetical protein